MAILIVNFMILAAFAMTAILISSNDVALGQSDCVRGDYKGLATQCLKYLNILWALTNPSPQCGRAIRTINVPRVCKNAVIDMAKVASVAQSCGVRLAPGTECGSYTVP